MGRGKRTDEYVTPRKICNDKFKNKWLGSFEKHKPEFVLKKLSNEKGYLKMHRIINNASKSRLSSSFKKQTDIYNAFHTTPLIEKSAYDLMLETYQVIEDTNSVIFSEGISEKLYPIFLHVPMVAELYLWKTLFPLVFDFKSKDGYDIEFSSKYIENNFKTIYRNMHYLSYALIFDGFITAIVSYIRKQSESISEKILNSVQIYADQSISDIATNLNSELRIKEFKIIKSNKDSRDSRIILLRVIIPSLATIIKQKYQLDKNSSERKVFLQTALKGKVYYTGGKFNNSCNNMISAYNEGIEFIEKSLKDVDKVIYRMLNLCYLNDRTSLLDACLTREHFQAYKIRGIMTKFLLVKMIEENNNTIIETHKKNKENNQNSHVPNNEEPSIESELNNPCCIEMNLKPRDYETIDFLIERISQSILDYYLPINKSSQSYAIELINLLKNDYLFNDIANLIDIPLEICVSNTKIKDIINLKDEYLNN